MIIWPKYLNSFTKLSCSLLVAKLGKWSLVCNSFRTTFLSKNHTDSFLAVVTHINITSCNLHRRPYNLYCVGADVKPCSINLQFIKQLLQCFSSYSTKVHLRITRCVSSATRSYEFRLRRGSTECDTVGLSSHLIYSVNVADAN